MTFLREDVAGAWTGRDPLEVAFALEGEVFRDVPGRRTLRVEINGRSYFVKLHYGVGWGEVFKNWLQLKTPIIGAENEYEACTALADVGIVEAGIAFAQRQAQAGGPLRRIRDESERVLADRGRPEYAGALPPGERPSTNSRRKSVSRRWPPRRG